MKPAPYAGYRPTDEQWFPDAPGHWVDSPIWTMFTRDARKGFPSETLLSVYRDHGVVPKASRDDNNNRASEDLSTYQLVEPGDLVVNKMKAWQGSVSISRYRGIVSPAYFVYRPHHEADDRYLHHLLRARPLIAAYIGMSKGVRINQWDLEPQNFSRLKLPLPPLHEQRAIADYLDRETAMIDTLVSKQGALISALRERRGALVSHTVSGEYPEVPFVRCMTSQIDYRGATPAKADSGIQLVTAKNVKPGFIDYQGSQEFVDPADYDHIMRRGKPKLGDLLFTMEAPLGNVALVDRTDIALAQRVIKWSVDPNVADPRYLMWAALGSSFQQQLTLRATGSTALGIKASKLPELRIPLPPLDEQRRLAGYLDRRTQEIDLLVAKTERFIELAKERRAALITAAVTGQIDVRGEVA